MNIRKSKKLLALSSLVLLFSCARPVKTITPAVHLPPMPAKSAFMPAPTKYTPKALTTPVMVGTFRYPPGSETYLWDLEKTTNGVNWVPVLTNLPYVSDKSEYTYTNSPDETVLIFRMKAH